MSNTNHPTPVTLPPYESDLVCDFFRQIGRLEIKHLHEPEFQLLERLQAVFGQGQENKEEEKRNFAREFRDWAAKAKVESTEPLAGLVGNAQNPLDHLVGDVCVQSPKNRYFIIEFKREASGFLEEVDLTHGKLDRAALLSHLESDDRCRELSLKGHFGAHWTAKGLSLQTYFTLVTSTLDQGISIRSFFYDHMHIGQSGWTIQELEEYIECMTAHGILLETDSGKMVFGCFTPEAKFVLMVTSSTILAMIKEAFKRGEEHRKHLPINGLDSSRKSSRGPGMGKATS